MESGPLSRPPMPPLQPVPDMAQGVEGPFKIRSDYVPTYTVYCQRPKVTRRFGLEGRPLHHFAGVYGSGVPDTIGGSCRSDSICSVISGYIALNTHPWGKRTLFRSCGSVMRL